MDPKVEALIAEFDAGGVSPLQKLQRWIGAARERAIAAAQRRFDPNYTRMMAELYNMQHRNEYTPYFDLPLVGSDSTGQTPVHMMAADPRWYGLLETARGRDDLIDSAAQRRHSPWVDPLEAKAWEQQRIQERLKLLSQGGL